ncbi:MAG: hypothetical protein KF894_34095 [Labilithrix sp.]|nr:hypothetical protein [Labilithrix sp.]
MIYIVLLLLGGLVGGALGATCVELVSRWRLRRAHRLHRLAEERAACAAIGEVKP